MPKLLLIALLACCAALAGDPAGFNIWKGSVLKGKDKTLAPKIDAQKSSGESLAEHGNHRFAISYRGGDGIPEVHEKVNDVFVVEGGEATLVVGGTVRGGKQTAPGEIRGQAIEGGVRHKLTAGDIVHIPANMPHQLLVEKTFTYFVIKIDSK